MKVSAIVVGYGDEPHLTECLQALLLDLAPGDEVVLVDNGIVAPPELGSVSVVGTGANLGFAGGAFLGAAESNGDVLVFVNSDAVVRPGSVAALCRALEERDVGLAGGCVLLATDPGLVNSCGNPVHVTGLSWAGGYLEPFSEHDESTDVTSVSGALFAVRRGMWDELGGLDARFFMYYEDADLSLRCWLAGRRVRYVPEALATHTYDFSRNPLKMHLLERNRLLSILTVYPGPLLRRALPVILLTEPLLFVLAKRDGWLRQRVDAWCWLLRHRRLLVERRRAVQASVTARHALDHRLTTRLTQSVITPPPGLRVLDAVVTWYWGAVGQGSSGPVRNRARDGLEVLP